MKSYLGILLIGMLFKPELLLAQKEIVVYPAELYRKGKLEIGNREVKSEQEQKKQFLKFVGNGLEGGVIWLPVEKFGGGKIEFVARGMDVLQGSFVGIAFHGINDSTYDYVYCRPFNFRTTDSLRRIHQVQYTHPPKYEWQYLRTHFNGQYEKGIANPPEINAWFKMTLIIDEKEVKAFINDEASPSLTVNKLNHNSLGKIGISGTGADVAHVKITYSKRK